ncbi:MAG: MATE family efflux transporter [Mogibacterium sp.]|nr:MATE family efflux transporter [Mogibacterium sp.]
MTEGNIARLLIAFAIPLLLGNAFQQLYNMVDTWVVGNFVSNEAFSAVGTVGPIINTLISLFMGFSSGAGVVIAQYYGAGKREEASRTVHTAVVMTAIFAVVLSTAGVLLRNTFLHFMRTPDNVLPEARTYLLIFFSGVGSLMFYNIGAATLQAIGDSKRPFYFLATAATLNIIGDLTFVLKFHMGVEGVALATILAMLVSAVLVFRTLFTTNTCVRIHLSKLRIDPVLLKQIFRMGIPAAAQMAIISFSNVFVQGYINQFGADVMSGWTSYAKIDALVFLPIQSIALATTTFVGQNIGSGQIPRARDGVRTASRLCLVIILVLALPVMVFAPNLVAFFNAKPEVVMYGTMILRWMTPFYLFASSANIHNAGLRGSGDARTPMMVTIFCYVIFRQIYLFTVSHFISNTLLPLALSYPAGWILCTAIMAVYYRKANFGHKSVAARDLESMDDSSMM